jgi:threonine/homoserine/homoserine lactone efflux protein
MTKTELISKLDTLKMHSRPLLVAGLIITGLNTVAVVLWMTFYQRHMNPHQVVVSGLVLFSIYVITCGTWLLAGKAIQRRYAPTCPHCGSLITWGNRSLVASTGSCPKCGAGLFE